jgi:hypothetical protein
VVVAVAPGLLVDEAAVVVAQGGGVTVVVPHVLPAVLVEVGAGVAALTGVDADRGAPRPGRWGREGLWRLSG